MIVLDRLLVGGLAFVLRRIAEAVDAEQNNEDALREELLAAQMRLELGEISEKQFETIERAILKGMREIGERRGRRTRRRAGEKFSVESVEAKLDRDEEPGR